MLPIVLWLGCAAAARGTSGGAPADVFYEALHGDPVKVESGVLLAAPGRFVGRAVKTRGLLERGSGASPFELRAGGTRALLRLEPEAAALVSARAPSWAGQPVEVEGFFYREARDPETAAYALRAWRVRPLAERRQSAAESGPQAAALALADLVYGAGRYDGQLVRVRGLYRGSNLHDDLPEATRKGSRDWVLKDGYFAVWITGREARGEGWDLTGRGRAETDAALEVVGVPTTSGGIVRIAAREIASSMGEQPLIVSRALPSGDAGWAAVSPRVSFTYPVPGEALGPCGHMIVQFSKPMDPARFGVAVRVRYEREGSMTGTPRLSLSYRDRYRALVITPQPPPPPGTEAVVELLEGVIDVDGRALTRRTPSANGEAPRLDGAVIEELRFGRRR